jgi:hypothetical protein
VKNIFQLTAMFMFLSAVIPGIVHASNFIPADNPNIQYFGRWNFSDKLNPTHSWPGVYIYAEFTGTSIGVRLNDSVSYYNVYIDGDFVKVFHSGKSGESDFMLAENLENKNHTIRFAKRNISFDDGFSFGGFILDDAAEILTPAKKPERKIEFVGDSFTAAESNEATAQSLEWEARFPVTNIDKGFAPIIARHFKAQYTTTCRSGSGMVCDWQGNTDFAIPKMFDRTLMENPEPKWDFNSWVPNVVVICLGLNDFSGLNQDGIVTDNESESFRKGYHDFIKQVKAVYPQVKIVAVAAFPEWIRKNVKQVVDEENAAGNKEIYYTQFDYFDGGYVANGHPTVETHKKMAEQIIAAMDTFELFSVEQK